MAIATLVLAIVGCATMDPREDIRIEAEVKARLVAEKTANLTRVGVTSSNGSVYLTGTVVSAEQREQAGVLARDVPGVKRVVNRLDVRPPVR
jgi:hyperosmotically inducible protein